MEIQCTIEFSINKFYKTYYAILYYIIEFSYYNTLYMYSVDDTMTIQCSVQGIN